MPTWRVAAGPVGAAAVAAGVLVIDPFDGGPGLACPFHAATGWWCPGCGATRATWLLLHGDLGGVVHHNLLYLPALVFLGLRWLHTAAPVATAWLPNAVRDPSTIPTGAMRVVVAVIVAFTVARNLPLLDWLAPPPVPT
jgi:hypothetical protein